MSARSLTLATIFVLAGCRTSPGPDAIAERYARALEQNQLHDAYALTSEEYRARTSEAKFAERYAAPAARTERAGEVRAAIPTLSASGEGVALVRGADGWRVDERSTAPRSGPVAAAIVLRRFVNASEQGDFETAYRLLAAPLRARYTPKTFAEDFRREPLSKERLARAREASLNGPIARSGGYAFPVGPGKEVLVVREADAYRIAAIE